MERPPLVELPGVQQIAGCRTNQASARAWTMRICEWSGRRPRTASPDYREFSAGDTASASAARQASGTVTEWPRPRSGLGSPQATSLIYS